MKTLLMALLLFSNILFAQESEPQSPETETHVIDVDPRCKNAVAWGMRLMINKQNGLTHEQTRQKLEYDYMYGALGNARPEVLAYMFDIIDLVYSHKENRTVPEIVEAAKELNNLCVSFMETPAPPKQNPASVRT